MMLFIRSGPGLVSTPEGIKSRHIGAYHLLQALMLDFSIQQKKKKCLIYQQNNSLKKKEGKVSAIEIGKFIFVILF